MKLDLKPVPEFRRAVFQDKEELWQIIHPIVQEGGTYVFDPDTDEESMMAYWLDSDKNTYVAEVGGEILGTFYIKANQPDLGNHICNAGFMVSKKAAGRGIGKAMGRFALEEAKRLGYHGMQFNFVIKTNEKAVNLWKSLGFRVIGEIPEAYRHPQLGMVSALIIYQKL